MNAGSPFGADKNILKLDYGGSCTTLIKLRTTEMHV